MDNSTTIKFKLRGHTINFTERTNAWLCESDFEAGINVAQLIVHCAGLNVEDTQTIEELFKKVCKELFLQLKSFNNVEIMNMFSEFCDAVHYMRTGEEFHVG